MATKDFTSTINVDKTAKQAFDAITNIRGWWSEEVQGGTTKLNDEFTYHYKDLHRCRMRLTEIIPNKKLVWDVLDNEFNFIKDKTEWLGTKIVFDISEKDGKTQVKFTHVGLTSAYECYNVCKDAWTDYIQNSLRSLIETGKGQPNPKEEGTTDKQKGHDYQTSLSIEATPQHVFDCINNVKAWWTDSLEGSSSKLGDEFTVRFYDGVHVSTQKLVEFVPDKKVSWLVTDSRLNFIKKEDEWTGDKITFELHNLGNKFTRIVFTQHGLAPEKECYNACSGAWSDYIQNSLAKLITTGKGAPTLKAEM